jgi:hypothetical protein
MTSSDPNAPTSQPDPESSSDGDRSVKHVIEQTREYGDGDATDEG